jgi:antitoxin component YwqK of YwqJK toxin-antitoxin module
VGPYKSYHPNGKIAMTGQYADGKKDGPFTEYFPNGKMRLEAEFKAGRKEGKMIAYDFHRTAPSESSFCQ